MSLAIEHLLGMIRAPKHQQAQAVGVPLTVRFTAQDCRWKIQGGRLRHIKRRLQSKEIPVEIGELDPWQVRSDFLRVETSASLLAFLSETGVFSGTGESGIWAPKDLLQIQSVIRYLLETSPERWRYTSVFTDRIARVIQHNRSSPVEFWWTRDSHGAALLQTTTLGAMLATVQVDHLRGAKFAFCERADCRKQYQIQSRHRRKYCSVECAHLMAVRAHRSKTQDR